MSEGIFKLRWRRNSNEKGALDGVDVSVIQASAPAYPQVFIDNGMEDVYDLYTTAGAITPKAEMTPWGEYPLGPYMERFSGYGNFEGGGATANIAVEQVNFTNWSVAVRDTGTHLDLTDCWLGNPATNFQIRVGMSPSAAAAGAPTLTATHITVDMNLLPLDAGSPAIDNNISAKTGDAVFNYLKIYDCPRNALIWYGGSLTLNYSLIGSFGGNTEPTDHNEAVYMFNQGTLVIDRCLLDAEYGDTWAGFTGGWTGIVYLRSETGPITATISNTAFLGTYQGAATSALAISARAGDVTLTITNCILKKGTSDYIQKSVTTPGRTITIVDGGSNRDYDTGAIIDLSGVWVYEGP